MGNTYKILWQSKNTTTTLVDQYTVPGGTSTVVSTMVVCNQSNVATSFRISVAAAGTTDTGKQYLKYDVAVGSNASWDYTEGVTLAATDVVRFQANATTLSFNGFGVEIT
jgi:hypothetical protein